MTEYGKTSKTMDALERLKSEMAKYGDIEPKERDERWRTVLSKKTENADISYADTSSRGRHWFVPTVGCDGESYGFPRTIGYGMQ